eukprot:scaffold149_cov315-Pinguiococcus_pyrenoidosus.AAC.72
MRRLEAGPGICSAQAGPGPRWLLTSGAGSPSQARSAVFACDFPPQLPCSPLEAREEAVLRTPLFCAPPTANAGDRALHTESGASRDSAR